MILFRCWYCNRRHVRNEEQIGERFTCSCERLLRVPRQNDGRCRVKSLADWIVEGVVYGGIGAFLAFGLALRLVTLVGVVPPEVVVLAVVASTLAGFLLGLLGGERLLSWVSENLIRSREES